MRISRLIACLALPLVLAAPAAALAQQSSGAPNPAAVQSAVKNALQSVNLTPHQKMQIAPMVQNYKSQTANADAATKKSAQEALLKQIYGVLTPDQQTKFKASLKASMASSGSSP
jgi:Spy/CpxP family protein refolding chaperone